MTNGVFDDVFVLAIGGGEFLGTIDDMDIFFNADIFDEGVFGREEDGGGFGGLFGGADGVADNGVAEDGDEVFVLNGDVAAFGSYDDSIFHSFTFSLRAWRRFSTAWISML